MLKLQRRLTLTLAALLLVGMATVARAAVDLTYFVGEWVGDEVVLEWGTGSEADNAGFNVWRSDENLPVVDGQVPGLDGEPLNATLITNPSGPNCQASSAADYTYIDDTVANDQGPYYYYLQSINCTGGGSTFYGAPEEEGGLRVGTNILFLPVVFK